MKLECKWEKSVSLEKWGEWPSEKGGSFKNLRHASRQKSISVSLLSRDLLCWFLQCSFSDNVKTFEANSPSLRSIARLKEKKRKLFSSNHIIICIFSFPFFPSYHRQDSGHFENSICIWKSIGFQGIFSERKTITHKSCQICFVFLLPNISFFWFPWDKRRKIYYAN